MSRDGRWVTFQAVGKGIHVAAVDGSAPVRELTHDPLDGRPCFARDGAWIYYQHLSVPTRILRVPFNGGAPAEVTVGGSPAVSPTADLLAYIPTDPSTPMLLDLRSGARRAVLSELPAATFAVAAFSPDGARLAAKTDNGVFEIDLASGRVVRSYSAGTGLMNGGISYDQDKLIVALSTWSGDLWTARVRFPERAD